MNKRWKKKSKRQLLKPSTFRLSQLQYSCRSSVEREMEQKFAEQRREFDLKIKQALQDQVTH